jgi:hypothetical protein
MWYLTKKVEPNYVLLNNAVKQTHPEQFHAVERTNLKSFLIDHLEKIDVPKAQNDVARFIENKDELNLLTKENLRGLINRNY